MAPLTIKCPVCGADNRLPRLHCEKCGSRLDEAAEAALRAPPRRRFRVLPWIRWALLLVALTVFCLLLWPYSLELAPAKPIDARRYLASRALLSDALDRGAATTVSIRDADVNAFLVLHARPAEGSSWSSRYEGAVVDFTSDSATVILSTTRGPLRFTMRLVAEPDGDGLLRLAGARFGHMPLPVFAVRALLDSGRSPFKAFAEEIRILRAADSFELGNGAMIVSVPEAAP